MGKKLDISNFSIIEAFNDENGKTSSTKLVGVITSFVCLSLFIILVCFYFFNQGEAGTVLSLIDKTTVYFGVAAGLMGVKSVSTAIGNSKVKIGGGSSASDTAATTPEDLPVEEAAVEEEAAAAIE